MYTISYNDLFKAREKFKQLIRRTKYFKCLTVERESILGYNV